MTQAATSSVAGENVQTFRILETALNSMRLSRRECLLEVFVPDMPVFSQDPQKKTVLALN